MLFLAWENIKLVTIRLALLVLLCVALSCMGAWVLRVDKLMWYEPGNDCVWYVLLVLSHRLSDHDLCVFLPSPVLSSHNHLQHVRFMSFRPCATPCALAKDD